MRRAVLLAVFLGLGISLLLWLSGGPAGPGSRRPPPEVAREPVQPTEAHGIVRPMNLPVSVDVVEGYSQAAKPESLTFKDSRTGESVLVPLFQRWHFKARRGSPVDATKAGRQALVLEDVEVLTYREPRTLMEARAIEQGTREGYAPLTKWKVTAPKARVDDLALRSLDEQPGGPETVVQLSGGVRIFDLEKQLEIQSETLEVQPYLDRARGTGRIVLRHAAFELVGSGLVLQREENRTRVEIREKVHVDLHGDLPGADGKPVLDLGSDGFRPGSLGADGGAVLVHRGSAEGGREDLTIDLSTRVHAEQEGGRTLDAETLRVSLYHVPREGDPQTEIAQKRWHVERFDAGGGVIVLYPGATDDGERYTLSASSRRLIHEIAPGGVATTLLEGDPEVTLQGDAPLEGLGEVGGPGLLRARAREQAWLGPALPTDVPSGADPTRYRMVKLRGDAVLTFRGSALEHTEDTLAGEQMTMLLKERTEEELKEARRRLGDRARDHRPARIVAVSFAVLEDVRLGGTRMSGMTHRLVAADLDTDHPVLEASGPGTSFAFHGLRSGERMLGGSPETAPRDDGVSGSDERRPSWVFERLRARDDVVVSTTLGGPAVGVPARVEAAELTYDRVSDRARVRGTRARPALFSVGEGEQDHQQLTAERMSLDRRHGLVEANGTVRGVLLVRSGSAEGTETTASAVVLPPRRLGVPATFGVATNGRIEIRTQIAAGPWRPRLDAEQVIRIEGDLVAEVTSETLDVDSLRARWLEVALVQTLERTEDAPSAGAARVGLGDGPTPAGPRRRRGEVVPWHLETERLQARFGSNGMESIEASGGIRFSSTEGEIAGDAFEYEAATQRASIRGRARATFGPEGGRSEVRAHALLLTVGDDGPSRLEAQGSTLAVLIRRDEKDPTVLERFLVWCEGVTMTPTEFRTIDATQPGALPHQVRQERRQLPDGSWQSPFNLGAHRIEVFGKDLLSRRAAQVERLVASGRDTTLQSGEGTELTTVWGDRFVLDVKSSEATLEAGPSGDLMIQRGSPGAERASLEQTRLVIDMETGEIRDWDYPRVILRGVNR